MWKYSVNIMKKKACIERHLYASLSETADKLSCGCSVSCQMLSQSNIKPYVSLLWLFIAGAQQSIGAIRKVLRGGAGCEIKGLLRKKHVSAYQIILSCRMEKIKQKQKSRTQLRYARPTTRTHVTHTRARSPVFICLQPAIKKVKCTHIFTHCAPLSVMNMIIGQVSCVWPINILST